MFWYILTVVSTLICLAFVFFIRSFSYWERKNVPYLPPSIPFGNLESFFQKTRKSPGIHLTDLYVQSKARNLPLCGLYFFSKPILMINDLDLIKNVLSKDFNHFVDRGFYYNEKDDPIGAHLFAIGGKKWRNLRRKLTPTFTSGKMRGMFKTVADCGLLLEEVMEKQNGVVDIKEILARFTTNVIGSCAFGLDCKTLETEDNPFRVYSKKLISLGTSLENLLLAFAMSFPEAGRALGIRQIKKDVADFFFGVVKDTIEYREVNQVVRKDFLQLLLELKGESQGDGNFLTLNEIAAQCLIFFLAGFETSSSAMSFALYEMSRNPEIQEKVRQEVIRVLAKYNGEINYDAISEMTYMGQVIDETLRLYPALPAITRVCVEDYKIPEHNLTIEKGTKIVIPIHGIHHDPEHFPEPEKFDPDRFSPENRDKLKQYSHLPFGEGNRICIGLRFGVMQTKVGLTVLLKNYQFRLKEDMKVPIVFDRTSFILSAEGGIWLNYKKINS